MTEHEKELVRRLRAPDDNGRIGEAGMTVRCAAASLIETYSSVYGRLEPVARAALDEMCRTVAPRDSFTEVVDQLDAILNR